MLHSFSFTNKLDLFLHVAKMLPVFLLGGRVRSERK